MIQKISDWTSWRDILAGMAAEGHSAPVWYEAAQDSIRQALEQPKDHCVLVSMDDAMPVGVFILLVLQNEAYLELLKAHSETTTAYSDFFDFLARMFPGWTLDAALNPENMLLRQALEARGAEWEKETQRMVLQGAVPDMSLSGVVLCDENYAASYCAIHEKNCYWTGERVLAAPDRFRVYVAIHNGEVVGHVEVTKNYDVNEPYSLFVLPAYRRMGYGRKLMARAIQDNKPKGMDLYVELDNAPAIRLYESLGFYAQPHQNCITAHWKIPMQHAIRRR